MMEIRSRETVILASNFPEMIDWYQEMLGFTATSLVDEDYHYCNLETQSGIKIGIAVAGEMAVEPKNRADNSIVLQIEVDNVQEFFEYLQQNKATITGDPSLDTKDNFWFGSFADPEGNPFWVVNNNCP